MAKYGAAKVLCDLGTDCSDCGAWVTDAPKAARAWQPVKELTALGMPLYVKHMPDPPAFYFTVTEPSMDVDQSMSVLLDEGIEVTVNRVWSDVLRSCTPGGVTKAAASKQDASGNAAAASNKARDSAGSGALVVDVGGHFGYYSLLAAAHGCRAVAWEPVPRFAAFFKYSLLLNNFTSRVDLREAVVGAEHGGKATISYATGGALGLAGIGGLNLDDGSYRAGVLNVTRTVERVDAVVSPGEEVLMFKADVEGFEADVLRGAAGLFRGGPDAVRNVVFEYSPGVWERHHRWAESRRLAESLLALLNAGYTALDVPFGGSRDEQTPLRAVTKGMLAHDVADMARMESGKLGCPTPAALQAAGLEWCGSWPLGTHPQSFHSTFLHNTNVWLARDRTPGAWTPNGTASLIDPDLPQAGLPYFLSDGLGTSGVVCDGVEPQYQPRYRCPCSDLEACGVDEKAYLNATAQLTPAADKDVDLDSFKVANW